jgi:hypothetical protein
VDVDATEAVREGIKFLGDVWALFRRQGFHCWARGEGCRCVREGKQGSCSGGQTIHSAVGALLFAGQEEIREWTQEQEAFAKRIEEGKDGRAALEELLSKKGCFNRVQLAGIDEFIARWAV